MKKSLFLLLTIALIGCSNNTSNNNSSSNANVVTLTKDDYGNVYGEVAQVLYTYNADTPNGLKRKQDKVENSDDLFSVAIMIKMFSEVYLSNNFNGNPLNTNTVKGIYEGAEMEFDVLSAYEGGYIYGWIRSFSEVFAPEESYNFIKVEYNFDSNEIISFDSYADYGEDGFEYSHYENDIITKLDLETIDEEYNSIADYIRNTKNTFIEQIKTSNVLTADFSTEIANVIEYSPW